MAIAKVAEWSSSSPSGTSATQVVTVTGTVPVGEHVVVFGATGGTGATLTVTDSKGNTYTTHKADTRVGGTPTSTLGVASAKISTQLVNGDTITLTWSTTSGARTARAVHYSGMKATGWFDQVGATGGNSVSNGSHTITGITTPQANELVLGLIHLEGNFSISSLTAGWTNEANVASGTTVRTLDWASKLKAAAGAESDLAITASGGSTSTTFMAAFLEEPAATPDSNAGAAIPLLLS